MRLRDYWLVPGLVATVAGVQLWAVTRGCTRWRGGGFGMYAEPHPESSRVWRTEGGDWVGCDRDVARLGAAALYELRRLKRWPSTSAAVRVGRHLTVAHGGAVVLEVWRPSFERVGDELYATRRRVAATVVGGGERAR